VLGGGCVPATNGAEALAVMDGARVSLALLDMRMPVLDGWGFARELRERRSWLPVIVMSAVVNTQQWTDEIGAAGCVSKPFDPLAACFASGSFPHVVWSVRA
jgi:two-component system, chemotaxis family, chemotaxis protein CheY